MNPSYADLYTECLVEENAAAFALRDAAITDLLARATTEDALDAVRIFFGRPPSQQNYETKFDGFFTAKDPGFRTADNSLERRVLAGIAVLRFTEEHDGTDSDLVALAATCANLQGKNPSALQSAIIPELENRIQKAANQRWTSRTGVPIAEIRLAADQIRKKTKEAAETPDPLKFREPLDMIAKHVFAFTERFALKSDLLAEESNMLWWVINHQAPEKPPAKEATKAKPILCGKELADLTVVRIGPPIARVLLKRALQGNGPDRQVTIHAAVNALEATARAELANFFGRQDPTIAPVLAAIAKAFEADGGDWKPTYKKVTSIPAETALTQSELAFQTYREVLLVKCLDNQPK